jgi:hypothetical protein
MFLDYDCVIIPGLGGFVCNERTAWYDEDREEMVPPSRDVLFNPNLVHNDGLLAQEIMRANGLDYSDAMKLVESEATKMIKELKNGSPIEIPKVGRLYTGEDGVIRFLPDAELVRMLGSFGHSRISLATINISSDKPAIVEPIIDEPVIESSDHENTPEQKVIPFRIRLARVAAVIAIPLALVGAWMLTEPEPSNTLMSVFPSLNTESIISSFTPSDGTTLISSNDALDDIDNGLVINYEPDPIIEAPSLTTEKPIIAEVTAPKQINFMIVGGAFSKEKNAKKLAKTLLKEGYLPTQHFQSRNNLYLVALGEFETERAARIALTNARESGRISTWLKKL